VSPNSPFFITPKSGGQGVEREPAAPLLNLRQSHRMVVPVGLGALGTRREVDVVFPGSLALAGDLSVHFLHPFGDGIVRSE
jgi:hypothetical protein